MRLLTTALAALPILALRLNAQYCLPEFDESSTGSDFYIYRVEFSQMDHSNTGWSSPSYSDYTNVSPVTYLPLGTVRSISVWAEANAVADAEMAVWIDFNHDGILAPTLERVEYWEPNNGPVEYTGAVSVPMDAETGPTLMRVLLVYDESATFSPCVQNIAEGHCLDYMVMITDGVVSQAPVADLASSTSTLPVGGGTVDFTDLSSNYPYQWNWTFEGGTPATSTAMNPQNILFTSPGCHEVTLTVSNNFGPDVEVRSCQITVEAVTQPPIAAFTANPPDLPIGGGTVDFFDQSSQSPMQWSWTFDGGTPATSSAQNPANISFTEPGCHDVTLTVTNDLGEDVAVGTCAVYVDVPVTDCIELFISEYMEGSANNKAVELYNSTGADLDLDGYRLMLFANGSQISSSYIDLTGTLPAYSTYVIVNPQADADLLALADVTNAVCGFNGDDAVVLRKNNVTIDAVGEMGVDPGASWPVGNGSTANRTLVRKMQVTGPNTDWVTCAQEWDVFAEGDISHLGSHAGACGMNTAIASQRPRTDMALFPIPASDMLVIAAPNDPHATVTYEVLTLQGSAVLRTSVSGAQHGLDVRSLAPGHYVLRRTDAQGVQQMARFCVMR